MEKKKTFTEIVNAWYAYFLAMKPGDKIEIAVKAKRDPALFIDICKDFIDHGNESYSFSNDKKYFKRGESWPK